MLIAEPKLLVIITNVTIGPGTTAFVSPDATSRIAASALAAGHPRRHRPHRRHHLCLHPPLGLASAAVRLRHPYQHLDCVALCISLLNESALF